MIVGPDGKPTVREWLDELVLDEMLKSLGRQTVFAEQVNRVVLTNDRGVVVPAPSRLRVGATIRVRLPMRYR